MNLEQQDPHSLLPKEWEALCTGLGLPAYRGRQIFQWLHQKDAASFLEMTDLPEELRRRLESSIPIFQMQLAQKQRSTKDETTKYLFRLRDGQCIESVLMRYEYGYSLCISSQVGCRMGCRFCASTLGGLVRNLSAGEMVQQVYAASKEAGVRISHVVVMGCGEPFDNYDALLRFFSLLRDEKGRGLSLRNITVSTCGLPQRIREFAGRRLGVTLAVSLHAAEDELRRQLMPGAARYSLDELLDACQYYTEETGRRITFEYALIKGCNDGQENAARLVERLRGMLAHVNLIPVNPVEERGLARPSLQRVREFAKVLERGRIPVTIRREMGADIDGACGQLRNRYTRKQEERPIRLE